MANKYASLIASAVSAIAAQGKADEAFLTLLDGIKDAKIKPEELKDVMVPALAKRRGLSTAIATTGRTAGQIGFIGDETDCAAARKELQRWSFRIGQALGWVEGGSGNNQFDPATRLFNSIAKMDGRSRAKLVRLMKEQGWV